MNREQKAVAIAEIAEHINESDAIFAVDYRGITVEQVAQLRAKLRDADATFKVVKNSLTERAADETGAEYLKAHLSGPTALTFVRGDVALAAKAIADYAKATQLLPFKGGAMGAEELDADKLRALSRLPARDVLYGQLVGIVASPVSGLVRTLNALLGGLAVALGQVREQLTERERSEAEIPSGDAPAAEAEAPATDEAPAEEPQAEAAPEADGAEEAQASEEPGTAEEQQTENDPPKED